MEIRRLRMQNHEKLRLPSTDKTKNVHLEEKWEILNEKQKKFEEFLTPPKGN